jgi:hypothetical protein
MTVDPALWLISLIKVFWLLLPSAATVRLCRSPKFKGLVGELRVSWSIWLRLDRRVYHAFSSVLLPTAAGTTQIDHLLVSPYGLFVIETKNMRGRISGGAKERTWTQEIGGRTVGFQNPLHQNYLHTKTLHELLGISEARIFSVIAFVGRSEFGSKMPDNVAQGSGFLRCIRVRKKKVLSAAQVAEIISALKTVRLKNSFRNRRRHIQQVKARVMAKGETACPVCGGPMVLRAAAGSGRTFRGCAAFPRCTGIRNAG